MQLLWYGRVANCSMPSVPVQQLLEQLLQTLR